MHIPVLLQEIIQALDVHKGDKIIDANFGFGGHSFALLPYVGDTGKILGLEWDPEVATYMQTEIMKKQTEKRIILKNANFKHIKKIAYDEGFTSVKGVVFDLGVATWHYKQSKRGFGFSTNDPLDMRLNPHDTKITAFEVVNYFSQKELVEIFKTYGEEYQAERIASEIITKRKSKKIETAEELSEVVIRAKRPKYDEREGTHARRAHTKDTPYVRHISGIHPATKVFMALRSFINDELGNLAEGLRESFDLLQPGGKIAILSFQGLEDKVIKSIFKELKAQSGALMLTKNVVRPTYKETKDNPSSRSAKLRVIAKPVA